MKSTIYLEKAGLDDIEFLKVLYNDRVVQNSSLNVDAGEITEKEIIRTIEYFEENNLNFFIVYQEEKSIGIALIYEINKNKNYAMIGIALEEKYRGKNISSIIITLLAKYVNEKYKILNLSGEVYSNNTASLKLVKKLNFKRDDDKTEKIELNNKIVYKYTYYKNIHEINQELRL